MTADTRPSAPATAAGRELPCIETDWPRDRAGYGFNEWEAHEAEARQQERERWMRALNLNDEDVREIVDAALDTAATLLDGDAGGEG